MTGMTGMTGMTKTQCFYNVLLMPVIPLIPVIPSGILPKTFGRLLTGSGSLPRIRAVCRQCAGSLPQEVCHKRTPLYLG